MSFLSYLINGVSLGSIYAIIALGYTMVYGIAKMLNFAHGDVIMIGAFVVLNALNVMNLPVIPAIFVAVVGCTVLGVVIERVAAEHSASDLWCGYRIFSEPDHTSGTFSGRRKSCDFFRYDRHDRGLYRDHGRSDPLYQ